MKSLDVFPIEISENGVRNNQITKYVAILKNINLIQSEYMVNYEYFIHFVILIWILTLHFNINHFWIETKLEIACFIQMIIEINKTYFYFCHKVDIILLHRLNLSLCTIHLHSLQFYHFIAFCNQFYLFFLFLFIFSFAHCFIESRGLLFFLKDFFRFIFLSTF